MSILVHKVLTSLSSNVKKTKILSGACRVFPNNGILTGGTNTFVSYRVREHTNVDIQNVSVEYFNGWVNTALTTSAQEVGTGNTLPIKMSIVTKIVGTALNQTTGIVNPFTWINASKGTLGFAYNINAIPQSAAQFKTAGGLISIDGLTITVPNGWLVRSDESSVNLSAKQNYFIQSEINVTGNKTYPVGITVAGTTLGEASSTTTSVSNNLVSNKDWTTGAAFINSAVSSAHNVFGYGNKNIPVYSIHGDSISNSIQDSPAGSTTLIGDSDGCTAFANRAFNINKFSWTRSCIPGASAGPLYTYGGQAIRLFNFRFSSSILTNMGHNDQGLTYTGAAPTGFLNLYRWFFNSIRLAALPGVKIVTTDLTPSSTSTDGFATTVNQTSAVTATMTSWNSFLVAGIFNKSLGDPDISYSINSTIYAKAAANGFTDIDAGHIKWPANGTAAPSSATPDGTHPKGIVHAYIAADLALKLYSHLG